MGNKDYRSARRSSTDLSQDRTVLHRAAGTLPAARRFVPRKSAARHSDPPTLAVGTAPVRQDQQGCRTSPRGERIITLGSVPTGRQDVLRSLPTEIRHVHGRLTVDQSEQENCYPRRQPGRREQSYRFSMACFIFGIEPFQL